MHSKRKGNIGEIALAKFLVEREYSVFTELGDISKIDLIAEKDGKLLRFQCKSTVPKNGTINMDLRKCGPGYVYKYKESDFDYMSLYDLQNHELYIFKSDILNNRLGITLRITPSKNNQYHKANYAEQYKAENILK